MWLEIEVSDVFFDSGIHEGKIGIIA
jgi:hypothetical protein